MNATHRMFPASLVRGAHEAAIEHQDDLVIAAEKKLLDAKLNPHPAMLLDEAEVNLQRILRAVKENKARIEQLVALACVSYDHMGKSMHQEVALSPEDHTLMFPHRIITEEE